MRSRSPFKQPLSKASERQRGFEAVAQNCHLECGRPSGWRIAPASGLAGRGCAPVHSVDCTSPPRNAPGSGAPRRGPSRDNAPQCHVGRSIAVIKSKTSTSRIVPCKLGSARWVRTTGAFKGTTPMKGSRFFRKWRFSLRKRASSTRSRLVGPSSRAPPSIPVCLTQPAMGAAQGSNSVQGSRRAPVQCSDPRRPQVTGCLFSACEHLPMKARLRPRNRGTPPSNSIPKPER